MNLYQCQAKAQDQDYDGATFDIIVPAGTFKAKWLDAYLGLFCIDAPGMKDGFVTVRDIDQQFPNLVCSNFCLPKDAA